MNIWPWTKKVIEEGKQVWTAHGISYGVLTGNDYDYIRNYVKYEVTNTWTGSKTIKIVYIT